MRASSLLRLGATLLAVALSGPALAQATRTWVSGVGDDANPCSRTAPCRTFAGALAKTAAGGEIDALDPGDFGTALVTKSITLDGGHALAGIEAAGVSGVVVSAGPADVVVLRRLRLHGVADPVEAPAGVAFGAGGVLRVESSTVQGFATGIDFRPAAGGRLEVRDVDVSACPDVGVAVGSADAATPARATLSGLRIAGADRGVAVSDHGLATVHDALISGAGLAALSADPSLGGDADLNVQDVVLSGASLGVAAQAEVPGQAVVRLSRLTSLDGTPAAHVGLNGEIRSFGDNRLRAGPDFTLSVDPPLAQVARGDAAVFTVSVATDGVSPAAVTLECAGLPAWARCAFSPTSLTPTGTAATSALTISTESAAASAPAAAGGLTGAGGPGLLSSGLLLVLLTLVGRRGSWRRPALGLGACVLALGMLGACGGGSSHHAPTTYEVTIRATGGVVTHEATISLVVQ
jgi:hypothetical protein